MLQAILSSTQLHTRAVLSSVTDTAWWKGAVKNLTRSSHNDSHHDNRGRGGEDNSHFTKQGCHPFYEDVIDKAFLNTVSNEHLYQSIMRAKGNNYG
jgi:hypothetical protein